MRTELERLKVLSALKLGYGKLTAKNTTEAEFKNIEDAIEIVKNCSIPNVVESKPSTKAALNASVKAIWFNDSADYLRFHYKVVSNLSGLEEPTDEDIDRLYDELNPE